MINTGLCVPDADATCKIPDASGECHDATDAGDPLVRPTLPAGWQHVTHCALCKRGKVGPRRSGRAAKTLVDSRHENGGRIHIAAAYPVGPHVCGPDNMITPFLSQTAAFPSMPRVGTRPTKKPAAGTEEHDRLGRATFLLVSDVELPCHG